MVAKAKSWGGGRMGTGRFNLILKAVLLGFILKFATGQLALAQ